MPQFVEGYNQGVFDNNPPSEAASWVGQLRKDARAAFVRRLVIDRIQNGGFEGHPNKQFYKLLEGFLIGTAIAVASHLIVGWIKEKK